MKRKEIKDWLSCEKSAENNVTDNTDKIPYENLAEDAIIRIGY